MKAEQRLARHLVGLAVAALATGMVSSAQAVVGGTTTDVWDCSNGGTVTSSSGALFSFNVRNMFGGRGSSSCGGASGNPTTLFSDFRSAGSVHFVEWTIPSATTITSFNLSAAHDAHVVAPAFCFNLPGNRRDARHRGFDHFRLYACGPDCTPSNRTLLFDYVVPFGDDNSAHPGENAKLYDPSNAISSRNNNLDIVANVLAAVNTNRWRAEFTQVGCPSPESGPRIWELDGFATADGDGDGVDDDVDNCPQDANADQADNDMDGQGDVCDADDDNDTVDDGLDNCPLTVNTDQTDTDGDLEGDACDADDDNDDVLDLGDNCPLVANTSQTDTDLDGDGDACDADDDNDGVEDGADNCPFDVNADQLDTDGDEMGDACDGDDDGDGVDDGADACFPTAPGDVVLASGDDSGCSIAQLCPCENDWKNHGGYVSCVAHAANDFVDLGLITAGEKDAIVSEAGQSSCGHKTK